MFNQVEAFHRPTSVPEALRLLQRGKGQARIIAGGTEMAIAGGDSVRVLIDISGAGLSYVRRNGSALSIGATTTLAGLQESEQLAGFAGGILRRAAATCGSASSRNLATLGANLANSPAAADMATPLLALESSVVLADARGQSTLPLAEYLAGTVKGAFAKSILVEVLIPEPTRSENCRWSFQKLGRTAVDISLVNVATGLWLDAGGRVKWARIAIGAAGPTAMRAAAAEKHLKARVVNEALIAEAAEEAARAVQPVSDGRASAEYRMEMCAVLVARALRECSL